jgi:D-alanyl-D-alanine carboxypeptidase (penicillin-binding protein 5/6)
MFHYLILSLSLLANTIGANNLATKIEQPIIKPQQSIQTNNNSSKFLPIPKPLPKIANLSSLSLESQAFIVFEPKSASVLTEKNGYKIRPMASTVKIMTAILTIERGKLDDTVTISPKAASQPGSSAGLRNGEQITVKNLLYGLMLNSGNDAAMALAEYVSGSEESFVSLMNQRASELGLTQFHASDPAGLDENPTSGTIISPYNLAKLMSYSLKYDELKKIMKTKSLEFSDVNGKNPRTVTNSNRFVSFDDPRVVGGKTGTGSNIGAGGAGHVLVSALEQNGYTLIGVAAGTYADKPTASYEQVKKLLNFSFDNIQPKVSE